MPFWENMKETEETSQKTSDYENAENNSRLFHEERMKNAPKIVQDYYNGTGLKFEKGLFKVLVAKKSNRIIFLIMVFCFAILFITNNFSNKGNLKVINGYECELQSFSYGLTFSENRTKNASLLASCTGLFQGLMPMVSYFLTGFIKSYVEPYAGLIVFLIFMYLGLKVIKEAFETEREKQLCLGIKCLLLVHFQKGSNCKTFFLLDSLIF